MKRWGSFLSPLILHFLFLCILFYLICVLCILFYFISFPCIVIFLRNYNFVLTSTFSAFYLFISIELGIEPWFLVDSLVWIISNMDFDKCVEPMYSTLMHVWHFTTLWAYLGLHEWIHLYIIIFSFLCDIASHECCFLELDLILLEIVCSLVSMIMIKTFLLFHLLNHTSILYTNFPCKPLWVYIFPFFHLAHYKPKCKTFFILFFNY